MIFHNQKERNGEKAMNTIRNFISKNELQSADDRLQKLIEIGAPKVMIDAQRKLVDNWDGIKANGDDFLLDIPYQSHEVKKGNGGKIYVIFNGYIQYFPTAKFGRFVSKKEGK